MTNAFVEGLALQAIFTLVFGSFLDGGWCAVVGIAATGGCCGGTVLIFLRRWGRLTRLDLLFLRFGYLPALAVSWSLSPFMGCLRFWDR